MPYNNRYLFDVLAIPLPQTVNLTITIGVQCVNEGERQSGFETVPVTSPALAVTPWPAIVSDVAHEAGLSHKPVD